MTTYESVLSGLDRGSLSSPRLYHYTTAYALGHIKSDKKILTGQMADTNGNIRTDWAVSLTSDPSPEGHGLPDGRELSDAQAKVLKSAIRRGAKHYAIDGTAYRLTMPFSADHPNVIHAPVYYKEADPRIFLGIQISAYYPVDTELTDEMIENALHNFQTEKWIPKGPSWYYHGGIIPFDGVIVERWDPTAGYVPDST
jgi:hypothetical protein